MNRSYLPHTPEDRVAMLKVVGANCVDDLFVDIPKDIRLGRKLDLPEKMDEVALLKELKFLASKNASFEDYSCFLGAGCYDHFIPVVVDHIISRSEFYTAYTQYQAEVAQGYLQALWEYQSMVCLLTGMAVSNASLYDGGTAAAEAMMMSVSQTKRNKVVVAKTVNPAYRTILNTYAIDLDVSVSEAGYQDGVTTVSDLSKVVNVETAAVIVQYPNFFGSIEDIQALANVVHEQGALFIVIVDPIALALLEAPGNLGADIVVGEGQSLGISTSFGGPGLGFMATTEKLMRKMPGRIVGQTVDTEGKRGFVLTLQAREQHIRREKANSNICSNQALCALAASVYLSTLGKDGFQDVASSCLQKAHYVYDKITSLKGFSGVFKSPFFKEFVVKMPKNVETINKKLLEDKIIGGFDLGNDYPELKDCMLICVTENRSKKEIDNFVDRLEALS